MSRLEHRIRSLCWQVETGSSAEAFAWRSLLHARGTDLLVPVLGQGFDAAVPEDEVVRIPRLSLHLRLNTPEELETVLLEAIRHQLRQQLNGVRGEQSSPGENLAKEESRFVGSHSLQSLLNYLQIGTLPWEMTVGSVAEQTTALCAVQRQLWPQLIEHLRRQVEVAPFYFRLLHLLPGEEVGQVLVDLADLLPGEESAAVFECLESVQKAGTGFSRYTRLSLLAALLAAMVGRDRLSTAVPSLAKVAASALLPGEWVQLEHFIAALPPRAASLFARGGTEEEEEDSREHPWIIDGESDGAHFAAGGQEETEPCAPIPEQASTQGHGLDHPFEAQRRAHRTDQTDPGRRPEPADALFPLQVGQAGLVLLHPYLGRFFEHCGAKEPGKKEPARSALPRLAALLHWLATGREQVVEFELGLIKVLLGLGPGLSLPVCEGLLTDADKVEAETLLLTVIDHWDALKKTSAQGLRTSFVERPGLLRKIEGGWLLNVERRPYDMLLERIPWSFSLIRLPWMASPLFVEW